MPKEPTDRRTVLKTAGAAALAAAAGPAAAQTAELRGTVTFEGGAAVPEGHLDVYLEDPALPDAAARRLAGTRLDSDGTAKAIAFTLPAPSAAASPTLRIVARLERADGWLIARGSAPTAAGAPVAVRLNVVTY